MSESLSDPLGVLLKHFRKRRHLTQQQLAVAIGVHRMTIGRWEDGSFLPESKALVLDLAKHLHLDALETRQLLEASLTALSPHWLVPFPRNPFFTGREETLEALCAKLDHNRSVAPTQPIALYGLGGVGKTQIALEYAFRHALEYSAIFWIRAETTEHILSSLLSLAEHLGLPERTETDQQRAVMAIQRWLTVHREWLLIWDNLENLDLLQQFLPSSRPGVLLITTRRQALGTVAQGIELKSMKKEEGMLFLLRRAKVLDLEATKEQMHGLQLRRPATYLAATHLQETLGGLPLALDQAGAYIEETGCGLEGYIRLYQQQGFHLLALRGDSSEHHPQSVASTFQLSRDQVEREQRVAADILQVCALLHAEAIPEEIFVAGASHLGPELASLGANAAAFDRALAVLRSLSLLQRQAETRTLSLHRLVQAVLRERMSDSEQALWLRRVLAALNANFPEVTYETWEQCERLLPHILALVTLLPASTDERIGAEVLRKAADYVRERARYEQARTLYQHVLHLEEQAQEPDHANRALAFSGLARTLFEQGQDKEAELFYLQALQIGEFLLESERPDMTHVLSGLGMLYLKQGNYEWAETRYQQALSIREQTRGREHLEVAQLLNNLAVLYYTQGKYEQAKTLYERVLHIREQGLGMEHPQLAYPLNNLGLLYVEQKQYAQAEPLYRRAMIIWAQALGEDHPLLAYPLNNLAELCAEQEQYAQAETFYQRAMTIWTQALGEDHPLLAYPLNGLANLFAKQGEAEKAEPLYVQAQSLRERLLGGQHIETAQTLYDFALFRQKQGQREEALTLAERALAIRIQSLGDTHPKTVAAHHLYMQLAQTSQDKKAERGVFLKDPGETERELLFPEKEKRTFPGEDPLQAFFAACCEFHPRAWCRSGDLWQAYRRWENHHGEGYQLARGAFAQHLKAHGCRADRTKHARIWRGITLVDTGDDVR